MRRFQKIFFIVFSFFCGLFLSCEGVFSQEDSKPETPSREKELKEYKEYLQDLFQKGWAHREQIKSGQMLIIDRLKDRHGAITREITIAFDEKRRRVDRHNIRSPKIFHDDVGCIGCYKKDNRLLLGYSTYYPRREGEADDVVSQTQVSIYDEKQLEENKWTRLWTMDYGFIPKYLACFCNSRFPREETLEKAKEYLLVNTIGMLGEKTRTEVTITDEEYKGTPCKKIQFETNFTSGVRRLNILWIAEEQGYSLRKHFLGSTGSPYAYEELLEVDVALDKSSGIWFPSAWHYERKNNGEFRISEDITIKNVILNKPIPESLFDMKDIKILPAGVNVQWIAEMVPPPYEGELLWDGNDIVSRSIHATNLVTQSTNNIRWKRIVFINTAGLALIFAMISWKKYQRLKQTTNG